MAATLAACACQTYRARPLDLEAHRLDWSRRSPSSEEIRATTASLGESRPVFDGTYDSGDGLSLPEGEVTALVYNAELRIARLRAAEASATAKYSGRWEDPVFGFDGERILSDVTHPWVLGASLAVTLPFSGRLDAEKREATAAQRAAIARVVADEWALRMRVRAAWLRWSFQAGRTEITRQLLEHLREIVTTATRLEQAGELTRIEARLFRAEQASRTIELRTSETRSREIELEIKALLGLVPDAPVRFLPATDDGTHPAVDVARHPHLAALAAAYCVAEEGLRLEIRKQYPDLVIAPGGKTDEGDARATLGLEIPLPLWNQNKKGIAEACARRATARAEYETGYEVLVGKAAAAELALASATEIRTDLETSLIPMLEEQGREVRRIVELGRVDTLVMLDTLVRHYEAQARLIDARMHEALARVQLEELAGPVRVHWETNR